MKIEKGKLYYNHQLESVVIAPIDGEDNSGIHSDKIAVHCPTKEDWEYVVSKGYYLGAAYIFDDYAYDLYYVDFASLITPDVTITIDQFKEFYPDKEEQKKAIIELYDMEKNDPTNPSHYNKYAIQPIDYIEANGFSFNEGNVIKYVSRYKQKNGLEDLKKARVYLDRLIDNLEKQK